MPVLAHVGGLDELLIIVVPVAMFLLFRWLAYRGAANEPDTEEQEAHARER